MKPLLLSIFFNNLHVPPSSKHYLLLHRFGVHLRSLKHKYRATTLLRWRGTAFVCVQTIPRRPTPSRQTYEFQRSLSSVSPSIPFLSLHKSSFRGQCASVAARSRSRRGRSGFPPVSSRQQILGGPADLVHFLETERSLSPLHVLLTSCPAWLGNEQQCRPAITVWWPRATGRLMRFSTTPPPSVFVHYIREDYLNDVVFKGNLIRCFIVCRKSSLHKGEENNLSVGGKLKNEVNPS